MFSLHGLLIQYTPSTRNTKTALVTCFICPQDKKNVLAHFQRKNVVKKSRHVWAASAFYTMVFLETSPTVLSSQQQCQQRCRQSCQECIVFQQQLRLFAVCCN